MSQTTYECAVTGVTADAGETGPVGTLPLGWILISWKRQVPNARYVEIQQLKEALVEQVIVSSGGLAALQPAQLAAIRLQADAQFAALEAATPRLVSEEEQLYLSPPEEERAVLKVYNAMRALLDLAPMPESGMEQEEEEEEEEGANTPGPAGKPPKTAA